MDSHVKKLIAPIIITGLCLLTFLGWLLVPFLMVLFGIFIPLWIRLLIGAITLTCSGVSIFVLIERMKEVRSGEEDDLSQY